MTFVSYPRKMPEAKVAARRGSDNVALARELRAQKVCWNDIKAETGLNNRDLISVLPPVPQKPSNRIPAAVKEQILIMRRAGKSYPEIAERFGLGAQTPRKICRKHLTEVELERARSLSALSIAARREVPTERTARYETIKRLRAQGCSYIRIAQEVGMTHQGVRSVCLLHVPIEIEEQVACSNQLASQFKPGFDARRRPEKCNTR